MSFYILIVDDEPEVLELYQFMLESDNTYVVEYAKDGYEAVEKYKRMPTKPDIVIMDYRMPIKDGIEATKEILSQNLNAKIIFASADPTCKDLAMMVGAKDFIKKPFSMDILIGDIKKVLG